MIPVIQTIFPTDKEPMRGNCYQACLASIFEMPLDQVPHFMEYKNWTEHLDEWLYKMGLLHVEVKVDTEEAVLYPMMGGAICLATGHTARHPTRLHTIVARTGHAHRREKNFEYLHDPHPDGTFLTKLKTVEFFPPMNPAEWHKRSQPR